MFRVMPIRLSFFQRSGEGLYKMTPAFLTYPKIPPDVRTRISRKWVYGKIYIQSAPLVYNNGLYNMLEPKAIFWAKPLPAQNDGLCQARALPFCARNFNGDAPSNFSGAMLNFGSVNLPRYNISWRIIATSPTPPTPSDPPRPRRMFFVNEEFQQQDVVFQGIFWRDIYNLKFLYEKTRSFTIWAKYNGKKQKKKTVESSSKFLQNDIFPIDIFPSFLGI